MKIVTRNNKHEWWIGQKVDCPSCRSVILLEESDKLISEVGPIWGDRDKDKTGRYVFVTCNICGSNHFFYERK